MDFLNKAYLQIVDLFRTMTPAARLTAGLLAAAIVVGLAFLFRFQTQSADDYLLGGRPFMAGELTSAQRALSEAGLKNWLLEGNRIKIPANQKDVYIAALAENNALPADWNAAMDKAVDGTNPFRSRHEIDISMQRAKQKELSMVISRFKNVEQAYVTFDEIEKGGLRRQKLKTASVAVQTSGTGLEEPQARAIRNLLSTSYAGLEQNSIAITDATTGKSYIPPSADGQSGDNLYDITKTNYEEKWKKKLTDHLSNIAGIMVGVNVEMDNEIRSDVTSLKWDAKPVPVQTTESTQESTSVGPTTSGRPGAAANGVGGTVGNQPAEIAAGSGTKSTQNQTSNTQSSVPGFEKTTTTNWGMRPKHVTAAINVPASYYVKIWKQLNPVPAGQPVKEPDAADLKKIEGEERKRIEDAVVNLLPPPPAGKAPYPLVTVSTYPDIPSAPLPVDTLMQQTTGWLASNWRTVAMFGMSCIGLLMLRGMLRNNPPAQSSSPAPQASHEEHDEAEETADETEKPEQILMMRRKLSSKGPNLREELRQLVKEDPDAAANVLRGWIGDAA